MCADNTHIHYLSDKAKKRKDAKYFDGKEPFAMNDLGVPIL